MYHFLSAAKTRNSLKAQNKPHSVSTKFTINNVRCSQIKGTKRDYALFEVNETIYKTRNK